MATHGLPSWPWTNAEADALPVPERLVLDAMRAWALAAREGHSSLAALRQVLVTEDATEAAGPLDALLRTLAAVHPMTLGCPLCPRVVGEEPALLLACALAQRGARREALGSLLRRLPPMSAYAAMASAIGLGIELRRAGLLLTDPWRAETSTDRR
jgi:hypothetical protein